MYKKFLFGFLVLVIFIAYFITRTIGADITGHDNKSSAFDSNTKNKTVPDDKDQVYTVVMGYIGDTQADEVQIEEAVNKILEPALHACIDLRAYSRGGYQQEIQLTLSGDVKLDIIPIVIFNASDYVAGGQVIDLTDLIKRYGTNIKAAVDQEFLNVPRIGDFTYGVTTKREQITWEGVIMRADLLKEFGYAIDGNVCTDITNLEQLGEAYKKIKERYPDMTMLASCAAGTPLFRWEVCDNLLDGFGVLMDYGQSTRVVNLYETEEFKTFAKLIYNWNQKGYLTKDGATTTETTINQMKSGTVFSYFTPLKAGAAEQDELSTGYDLAVAPLFGDAYITSFSVNFFTWGIAKNSRNTEIAFKVLDYMYGSPEIMNLLNWGIEDKHYKVVDSVNKVINYADGVTPGNTGYCMNIGWQLPNQELAYVWEGETAAKWSEQRNYIAAAKHSRALGFNYDPSGVKDLLTALNNVKNEWYDAIGFGAINPEEAIPVFNQALYDAGLQKVIDIKQKQLDAWITKQQ